MRLILATDNHALPNQFYVFNSCFRHESDIDVDLEFLRDAQENCAMTIVVYLMCSSDRGRGVERPPRRSLN